VCCSKSLPLPSPPLPAPHPRSWTHCYTPGIVLGGVGNGVWNSRVWEAPHQAIFLSGNEHTVAGCTISDVCRITADSGAFYFGRDLTYRGNRLLDNVWENVNSVFPGTPILYADDCASSITVVNNTFRNNSGGAAALEGGKVRLCRDTVSCVVAHNYLHTTQPLDSCPPRHTRSRSVQDHLFERNVLVNVSRAHTVSKGCAGALPFLDLVPWNTSAVWLNAYPTLAVEVGSNVNEAWNLLFADNVVCNCTSTTFSDARCAAVEGRGGDVDVPITRAAL